MVSYLIDDEQINLFGSQLATCQCYQVALESISPSSSESYLKPANADEQ